MHAFSGSRSATSGACDKGRPASASGTPFPIGGAPGAVATIQRAQGASLNTLRAHAGRLASPFETKGRENHELRSKQFF